MGHARVADDLSKEAPGGLGGIAEAVVGATDALPGHSRAVEEVLGHAELIPQGKFVTRSSIDRIAYVDDEARARQMSLA
jgi:hypothetical protein